MQLDRQYQRELLEMISSSYPQKYDVRDFFEDTTEEEDDKYAANMCYLEEHGLVESGINLEYGDIVIHPPKITAAGLDFLQDDGGLSAILGTVTVKLHADTLRDLLELRINETDLPQAEKKRFIDHLKDLPAEGLKHLTTRLIDAAFDVGGPTAIALLRTQLGL